MKYKEGSQVEQKTLLSFTVKESKEAKVEMNETLCFTCFILRKVGDISANLSSGTCGLRRRYMHNFGGVFLIFSL